MLSVCHYKSSLVTLSLSMPHSAPLVLVLQDAKVREDSTTSRSTSGDTPSKVHIPSLRRKVKDGSLSSQPCGVVTTASLRSGLRFECKGSRLTTRTKRKHTSYLLRTEVGMKRQARCLSKAT